MEKKRWKHSCCVLGNKIYAIQGLSASVASNHKSIEWIDASDVIRNLRTENINPIWSIIEVNQNQYSYSKRARKHLVVPVGSNEMLIFGGLQSKSKVTECYDDATILDNENPFILHLGKWAEN